MNLMTFLICLKAKRERVCEKLIFFCFTSLLFYYIFLFPSNVTVRSLSWKKVELSNMEARKLMGFQLQPEGVHLGKIGTSRRNVT